MTEKIESAVPAAVKSVKKLSSKPTHPPTSEMVNAAIKELKDRKGSSLQAIKKYVASTYKLDADKFAPFIKKYLKNAVASGVLIQPKGHGASGSFKLAAKDKKTKTEKSVAPKVTKKPVSPKKVAAPKAKKVVAEKRKTTKVAAKPPKAKSSTVKPKMTRASPKKVTKASSPMKKASAPKVKKPTTKKVAKN